MMNMECPICGKECEGMTFTEYEADFNQVAEFVYKELIERGYAPIYDDVVTFLDIVHIYMTELGANVDDES